MPGAKQRKKVLIYNLTDLKLRVYYKTVDNYRLRVAVLLFPSENKTLDSLHTQFLLEPGKFVVIPLTGDWKTFNGIVFDATRVKGACLRADYAVFPESKEYVLKIKRMAN